MKRLDAITDVRVNQVLDLILGGCRRRDILKWCRTEGKYDLSDRQIDRLISRAHTAILQEAEKHIDNALGKALLRLDMLFQRSLLITDYKACLAIEKERIELLGLRGQAGRRGPQPLSIAELRMRGSRLAKGREGETDKSKYFRPQSELLEKYKLS